MPKAPGLVFRQCARKKCTAEAREGFTLCERHAENQRQATRRHTKRTTAGLVGQCRWRGADDVRCPNYAPKGMKRWYCDEHDTGTAKRSRLVAAQKKGAADKTTQDAGPRDKAKEIGAPAVPSMPASPSSDHVPSSPAPIPAQPAPAGSETRDDDTAVTAPTLELFGPPPPPDLDPAGRVSDSAEFVAHARKAYDLASEIWGAGFAAYVLRVRLPLEQGDIPAGLVDARMRCLALTFIDSYLRELPLLL
jgi:hypothetical protein